MSDNLHDIDKLFRSAIDAHEEAPSEDVWNNIDKGLDKYTNASIRKRYRNLKIITLFLALLLIGFIAYFIFKTDYFKNNLSTNESKGSNSLAVDTAKSYTEKEPTGAASPTQIQNQQALSNIKKQLPVIPALHYPKKERPTISSTTLAAEAEVPTFNTHEGVFAKRNVTSKKTKAKTTLNIGYTTTLVTCQEGNNADIAEKRLINKTAVDKIPATRKKSGLVLAKKMNIPVLLQKNTKTGSDKNKTNPYWGFAAFISPHITSLLLKDGETGPRRREEIKEGEYENISFSAGIVPELSFSKNWSLQTGLIYDSRSNSMNPRKIYAVADPDGEIKYRFDCSSGYWYVNPKTGTTPAIGDSIMSDETTIHLKYLTIPLIVKYNYSVNRLTWFASAGLGINIFLKGKISAEIENENYSDYTTSEKIYGLKKNYLSGLLSVGTEYRINKKYALYLSPNCNIALTSSTQNAPVKSFPHTIGFAAGIKIRL